MGKVGKIVLGGLVVAAAANFVRNEACDAMQPEQTYSGQVLSVVPWQSAQDIKEGHGCQSLNISFYGRAKPHDPTLLYRAKVGYPVSCEERARMRAELRPDNNPGVEIEVRGNYLDSFGGISKRGFFTDNWPSVKKIETDKSGL